MVKIIRPSLISSHDYTEIVLIKGIYPIYNIILICINLLRIKNLLLTINKVFIVHIYVITKYVIVATKIGNSSRVKNSMADG